MTQDLIDNLYQDMIANNGSRLEIRDRQEGQRIINQLTKRSPLDLDTEIYTNCSGTLLLWVNVIF